MAKTGSQLDKYLLHEMIGGGGFATVYRATAYDFFAVARQNTTEDISDLIAAYFRGNY